MIGTGISASNKHALSARPAKLDDHPGAGQNSFFRQFAEVEFRLT
jgi:hypothetical protein